MKPKNNMKTILVLASLLAAQGLFADDAATFKKKCGSCHSLAGVATGKMGPDLSGYAAKRPAEYLSLYLKNPKDGKAKFPEIYNKEVKGKYGSAMPAVKLTDDESAAILRALK